MSSFLIKAGSLLSMCAAALLLGPTARAQDQDQDPDQEGGDPRGWADVAAFNAVEGRATVSFAVPEGVRVKKGEMVCELDPSSLEDRLANQELIIRGAEASLRGAELARNVAELAVDEYVEGIF